MSFRGNVAEQLEVGKTNTLTESSAVTQSEVTQSEVTHSLVSDPVVNPLDVLFHNKPVRQHVQEFALIFAILLLGVAGLWAYKRAPVSEVFSFMVAAGFLVVLGYRVPALLKPVWEAWMKFAEVLGKFMTFFLLSIMWIFLFIPLALLLKIIGKEVMNMRFREPQAATYWEPRNSVTEDFKLLERQY